MIISKSGLPHAEQYLVALKELRQQYLDWRRGSVTCPLCCVLRDCSECPWRTLTGANCFSSLRGLKQKNKILRKFKFLRKIALKINRPIAKRIKELDLWIAIYKQYIHYIKRGMPPELAMKLTKSLYGDLLNEARN